VHRTTAALLLGLTAVAASVTGASCGSEVRQGDDDAASTNKSSVTTGMMLDSATLSTVVAYGTGSVIGLGGYGGNGGIGGAGGEAGEAGEGGTSNGGAGGN
jgi:hypothetical protein